MIRCTAGQMFHEGRMGPIRHKKMGRQAARTPVGPIRSYAESNSKYIPHDPIYRMGPAPYPPTGDRCGAILRDTSGTQLGRP
jgi:hypothetical protein